MLTTAITLITGALALYTAGVWAERRKGTITWTHAGLFAAGLFFDTSGTWVMSRIAAGGGPEATGAAGILTQVMAITGLAAIVLMAVHLVWAVVVLWRDRPAERLVFHRFSIAVWGVWLLPYFTGMASAML